MKWQSVQSLKHKDMKVLLYSFDIMLGMKIGDKFFATMAVKIRKCIMTNAYNVDLGTIKEEILKRYPSLRNKDFHIEENQSKTREIEIAFSELNK